MDIGFHQGLLRVLRSFLIGASLCAFAILLPAQSSLQITSPANGTVVQPGAAITITISGSGAAFTQVLVIGEDPLGACAPVSGPPFQCSIQIPSQIVLGTYALTALGLDTTGAETDSAPIIVDVERSDAPVNVTTDIPSIGHLYVGGKTGLRVIGTYSDGSIFEMTKSTQTTYVSQSPTIVTVSGDGLVTAVGPGATQIV